MRETERDWLEGRDARTQAELEAESRTEPRETGSMKIRATLVGIEDHHRTLEWPDGWPVPREGEAVDLPGLSSLAVRTVVWYPEGDEEGEEGEVKEPFVYVVVGRPRP